MVIFFLSGGRPDHYWLLWLGTTGRYTLTEGGHSLQHPSPPLFEDTDIVRTDRLEQNISSLLCFSFQSQFLIMILFQRFSTFLKLTFEYAHISSEKLYPLGVAQSFLGLNFFPRPVNVSPKNFRPTFFLPIFISAKYL